MVNGFISHKQLRPLPHHGWAKVHHQQRSDSKKRPKRELILASNGPTQSARAAQSSTAGALSQFPVPSGQVQSHDNSDTDERSQQSSQQNGEEGAPRSEEHTSE